MFRLFSFFLSRKKASNNGLFLSGLTVDVGKLITQIHKQKQITIGKNRQSKWLPITQQEKKISI